MLRIKVTANEAARIEYIKRTGKEAPAILLFESKDPALAKRALLLPVFFYNPDGSPVPTARLTDDGHVAVSFRELSRPYVGAKDYEGYVWGYCYYGKIGNVPFQLECVPETAKEALDVIERMFCESEVTLQRIYEQDRLNGFRRNCYPFFVNPYDGR